MRGFWAGLVAALLVRKLSAWTLFCTAAIAFLAMLYTVDLFIFAAHAVSLSTVLGIVLVGITITAIKRIRRHDREYVGRHRAPRGWAR
jgi:hypothetical protein